MTRWHRDQVESKNLLGLPRRVPSMVETEEIIPPSPSSGSKSRVARNPAMTAIFKDSHSFYVEPSKALPLGTRCCRVQEREEQISIHWGGKRDLWCWHIHYHPLLYSADWNGLTATAANQNQRNRPWPKRLARLWHCHDVVLHGIGQSSVMLKAIGSSSDCFHGHDTKALVSLLQRMVYLQIWDR